MGSCSWRAFIAAELQPKKLSISVDCIRSDDRHKKLAARIARPAALSMRQPDFGNRRALSRSTDAGSLSTLAFSIPYTIWRMRGGKLWL